MAFSSSTLPNQFITFSKISSAAPSARFRQQSIRISALYGATTAEKPRIANSQTSLYEVLGVPMGATCQEIKTAYRRLARVLHPDVATKNNNGRKEDASAAANEFMEVHKAYATLSDPEKRADYDRTLFRGIGVGRRPSYSVFSSATTYSTDYTSRNWETDQCW